MKFPQLNKASYITPSESTLYISAYGFEDRSLGWTNLQLSNHPHSILSGAFIIKYETPKGKNKINELQQNLHKLGVKVITEYNYSMFSSEDIETILKKKITTIIHDFDQIILDITPLTKFLILLVLSMLESFKGTLRIVFSEAEVYSPTQAEFNKWKDSMDSVIKFPSKGFRTILRARCLSSIRMQGQPVTLVAFTSFNEQLVRYLLGSLSPYRLLFINGKPPRDDFSWRENATQYIHRKLIVEYHEENQLDSKGLLVRKSSTLNYDQTIEILEEIYTTYADYERIIIAATGSKMQTVGLFFAKQIHPDIHIEYPTPDSYYVRGFSTGLRNVHEITIVNFSSFIQEISFNKPMYKTKFDES